MHCHLIFEVAVGIEAQHGHPVAEFKKAALARTEDRGEAIGTLLPGAVQGLGQVLRDLLAMERKECTPELRCLGALPALVMSLTAGWP